VGKSPDGQIGGGEVRRLRARRGKTQLNIRRVHRGLTASRERVASVSRVPAEGFDGMSL